MRSNSRVAVAGLLAGTLHILFASLLVLARGESPGHMLQAIASGLLGGAAFQGGAASAVLGLACHLLIAIGMAWIFFAIARRWRYALDHLDQSVVAFGVAAWATMQYVVVPLSAAPFALPETSDAIGVALFSHVLFVALPIGLIASRQGLRQGPDGRRAWPP